MIPKQTTLSKECDDWAEAFAARAAAPGQELSFVLIRPNPGFAGSSFVGPFTDAEQKPFYPEPAWQWHVAVMLDGIVYDEVHQGGVKYSDYRKYFGYWDCLLFEQYDSISATRKAKDAFLTRWLPR